MRPPARVQRGRWAGWLARAGLLLLGGLLLPAWAGAATLLVDAQTSDGHALTGAAITVRSLDGQSYRPSPVHAVMDQVNRAFVPDLLVIPVGSTVSFPNTDSVSHQIYSFSPAKRFQLPLYRGKPYPPVHFDQPGVVTLGCNIHDQMLAYLLVTDAPWYGLTGSEGTWTTELPPGRYSVQLWHPRLDQGEARLARELTVTETDRARVTVRLSKSLQPAPTNERSYAGDY